MNVHVQSHVTTTQRHLCKVGVRSGPIRPEFYEALAEAGWPACQPPGFPPIEDGGLVSNTPLRWVVDREPRRDTLALQVDLWSARGGFHATCSKSSHERKEIRYSSRARAGTDQSKHVQELRRAVAGLLE